MIGAALGEQYPVVNCKATQRSSSTDQAWPTEGTCKSGKLWLTIHPKNGGPFPSSLPPRLTSHNAGCDGWRGREETMGMQWASDCMESQANTGDGGSINAIGKSQVKKRNFYHTSRL